MGRRDTKGTGQLGAEIDAELLARWRDFCAHRKERHGESHRDLLESALRRALANPPPPPQPPADPPLPPGPPLPPPRKRGRPPKSETEPEGGAT